MYKLRYIDTNRWLHRAVSHEKDILQSSLLYADGVHSMLGAELGTVTYPCNIMEYELSHLQYVSHSKLYVINYYIWSTTSVSVFCSRYSYTTICFGYWYSENETLFKRLKKRVMYYLKLTTVAEQAIYKFRKCRNKGSMVARVVQSNYHELLLHDFFIPLRHLSFPSSSSSNNIFLVCSAYPNYKSQPPSLGSFNLPLH